MYKEIQIESDLPHNGSTVYSNEKFYKRCPKHRRKDDKEQRFRSKCHKIKYKDILQGNQIESLNMYRDSLVALKCTQFLDPLEVHDKKLFTFYIKLQ